jgi:ABC-type lipoprotein release transport system permease subunit
MFVGIIVGTSVAYLFTYQIENLKRNITTVEHYILKDRHKSPFDSGKSRYFYFWFFL